MAAPSPPDCRDIEQEKDNRGEGAADTSADVGVAATTSDFSADRPGFAS
jgi:hypothetical protein